MYKRSREQKDIPLLLGEVVSSTDFLLSFFSVFL